MARPITNDYISATMKSFVSRDNNGKMIKKNFIEIEGKFLLKIHDNIFHLMDGEDVYKHINSATSKWFTNECIGTISTWNNLVEKLVLKLHDLYEHDEEEETNSGDYDPNTFDDVPEIFRIEDDLFFFDAPFNLERMAEHDTPPPTITAMKIPIIRKGEDLEEELASTATRETSAPPIPKTAKQLAAKRNQERVKSILLLAIPDEYLLKFHNFENFITASNESLDKAYDRFQKLISQLEVHGVQISKEDINQKFLISLPPSRNQISLIMRNKPGIDETDIDDLYNNLRVYKDEMKSTASEDIRVSTIGGTSQVPSTPCAHDVAYSFFVQPTTSSQLENEDFQQSDGDDLEELDLRWQVEMLTSKVECYNCYRNWHFARECRSGRNQGRRSYGDNGRSNAPSNESSSQALVAQDGLGCNDWSNDFEVEPVNYALMATSSSSSSSSSDTEVHKCSKQCLESFKTLQKNYDTEREKHTKAKLEIKGHEIALESLESRILGHEKNELAWGEKYEFQNYDLNQMSARDKTGLGYGTQLNDLSSNHKTNSENSLSVFDVKSSDEENTPENDRFFKDGYKVVPPPIIGNFLTLRADISFVGLDEYAIRNKIIESRTSELNTETGNSKTNKNLGKTSEVSNSVCAPVNRDRVIIEDWTSDDDEEEPKVQTVRSETQTVKTRVDKCGQVPQKQGISFKKVKACFVCKSTDHLNKDCSFQCKKSQEPKLKIWSILVKRIGLIKPVKHNEKRVVHTVSTARPVSTDRPSVRTVRPNVSTARPVSTDRPSVSTARPVCTAGPNVSTDKSVYAARPIYLRMDNVRPRASHSPIKRSYYPKTAFRPKDLKQDGKNFRVKNMTTAGTRAVVNTVKGKMDTDLKKSRWVWRPKATYLDHVSKDSGSFMLKKFEYVDPKGISKSVMAWATKLIFQTMKIIIEALWLLEVIPNEVELWVKKNSVLFIETECLILSPSFKLFDESQVVFRAPRKDDVYSLDLKNIVPFGGITYLYENATADESKLWHRRLGHVNFKNINKLVKGHLVRGLPSKVFVNDHICVAYKKGKQHKASCKAKLERTIRKPLELLHMDLFGPVSVESLENQLNHKVKIIRCDNGTKFKNYIMNEFCAKKGIKREFSVARNLQQNGVTERKNKTLIEAARTMLANSLLPISFWAQVVNTACYVLNRVLVTKTQNKTPYELLIGKPPSISFMRPFWCPLTILNTLNSLGKFDGKSDEGYLLGYSTTRSGPDWMFDLDFLTNTMNYIPVSIENQVNVDAGTQDSYAAGSSGKDKEPTQEYILLPLHPHRTRISVEDVVQDGQEKPSIDAPNDNELVSQELAAKTMNDDTRHAFEEEIRSNASQKMVTQATSTNKLSTDRPSVRTASTPIGANISESSFVYLGGQIPVDASTLPNADLPIDPNMPDLEDDSNVIPSEGIFNGAYDDEDVGAVADFNNMDNTINVSHIPTLRINKDYPKEELKNISQALQDESCVEAMQEELLQFKLQKVWVLVNLLSGKKVIGTKWVFRNKRDKRSIVVKNKARLVAQGFRQEEGIDYDEVFALVARIEAIRLFLAFASYMGFTVYQMDVKNAFLYGTIEEEVYVHQPPCFVDPTHPNKVYKVKQQPDGIFISQDKYVVDILKKFDYLSIRTATTPIESTKPLVKDEDGKDVDVHIYRSMISFLMYLTALSPGIMFAVCAYARFQVTPKASHLNAVKRIFRYLKHQPKLGLWYPRNSPFELEAFSDSDYGGAGLDRKSTTGGCQFLGRRLIS
ncbi:putative ribonuclease H-like domain-containing protein [Tanacetum coccineum]